MTFVALLYAGAVSATVTWYDTELECDIMVETPDDPYNKVLFFNIVSETGKTVALTDPMSTDGPAAMENGWYQCVLTVPSHITYNGETYTVVKLDYLCTKISYSLSSIILPNTVELCEWANGTRNLVDVRLSGSMPDLSDFNSEELKTVDIPEGIGICEGSLNKSLLADVVLPESMTVITGSLNDNPELENVCLKNPKYISSSFNDLPKLRSVTIPDSPDAYICSSFQRCETLEHVELPETYVSIKNCFLECTGLKTVGVKSETPYLFPAYSFGNLGDLTLLVPEGCVEAYRSSAGWREFGTILEHYDVGVEESEAAAVKVAGEKGQLRVNMPDPLPVDVYTLEGALVSSRDCDGEAIFRLDGGVYIVNTPVSSHKVVVR